MSEMAVEIAGLEVKRLSAIERYAILDTPEEAAFDKIAELAARILQAPIAVVSLVDRDRLWFKSHFGLSLPEVSRTETPRAGSFCSHTILTDRVMVVSDAAKDERFRQSPPVVGGRKIRFYAGAPLITPDGWRIGTLAIMDTRPRPVLTNRESASLADLAGVAMHELNLRQELAGARASGGAAAAGEAKFRVVMESASQGIVAVNRQGHIEMVNRRAEEMFGYGREEMLGQGLEMLLPAGMREGHAGQRKDYFSKPRPRHMGIGLQMAGRRKNGQEFPIEISLNYVEVGGESLAISFVTDISERVRLEQQYRQSQKMEAVGQLAGGVAHDFNNLLTVIQGYGAMALDGLPRDHAHREPLEEIVKACVSAAGLTRQLLAFSRRNVFEPQTLSLNAVIGEIDKMLRRALGEDVELTIASSEDLSPIRGDARSIEQVLLNLAINARDAMPRGGKLMIETANLFLDREYVGAHLATKTGPHAMLAVTDTGTGMSAEVQSRIFEPFFTTKGQGKGTGLGLATVYGIVQQMEGSIWVYSEVGKGTTFKILFPTVTADASAEESPVEAQDGSLGWETVLLVEDEDGVRKFVRRMLERQGYTVLEAATPEAALTLAGDCEQPIDLLLSDVVMPRMNGPEMAQRIWLLRPGLKALFMSGYTDRAIHVQAELGDGATFIQKPFTPQAMSAKLRELLNGKMGSETQ